MKWFALCVLTILVFFASWSDIISLVRFDDNPHTFLSDPGTCVDCHATDSDGQIAEDDFTEPIIDYCYGCHPADKLGRSHPVDADLKRNRRFPEMEVPDELVVGWDDVLTCATCHRIHMQWKDTVKAYPSETAINPGESPQYFKTFFLRIPGDPVGGWAKLCDACHGLL